MRELSHAAREGSRASSSHEKQADTLHTQLVHVLGSWIAACIKGALRQGQAHGETSLGLWCTYRSVLHEIRGNGSVRQCRGLGLFLK
jgi:hypothetical protein